MSRLVELPFDYKIKGSLRRFVDIMFSVTEFKGKYLCYPLKYCCHVVISGSTRPRLWIGNLG